MTTNRQAGEIRVNDSIGNEIRIVCTPRNGGDHSINILINGEEFDLENIVSALDSTFVCPPEFKRERKAEEA